MTEQERERLENSTFDDEGIMWRVLKVQWDDGLDHIVVFYYDCDYAQQEVVSEGDLHEDCEYVERRAQ